MAPSSEHQTLPTSTTTCAVVGGGPAGLVLGLLLARAGVQVTVLEKHADFLRDFRGDTVHPTTLDLLEDLGLFEEFDRLPHSRVSRVELPTGDGGAVVAGDFSRIRRWVRHPYIAMVPQWDLLNLLADAGRREPTYTLLTKHEVTGVVREGNRVVGVDYTCPEGPGRLLADLVVACDGRWSVVRRSAGLPTREFACPFDVWWFRIPTSTRVGESLLPRLGDGKLVIAIPREGYLQAGYLGRKGTDAQLRARGVEAFRADVTELLPELADEIATIEMADVKHLDVRMDRLTRWHAPGLLCIGDAAHAMSPAGGVGINLALQDAVAAARRLAAPLRRGVFRRSGPEAEKVLAQVQRRRTVPTVVVQAVQRLLHARLLMPALEGKVAAAPRGLVQLVRRVPAVTAVPAIVVGIGPRPERAPAWACRPARAPGPDRTRK
ncbi:2-polyprenyl-6-methoxyphenol hydroxylase [Pseudonocardia thermophila]|uniref:2-polyprenyl-6-methoxyphenol hydroxylase n=1 Tax=Pseudonocardia thermophila TaxID=1848 RepID=A0A1M6THD7_PSETH|nr:FAD-dependent oxidoreductase [Pseudonocardia thermophila]SHK56405.1 2-polyprenyl-6-methoxyphenol hydroxylase [Pseudonocardia thermophila]